MGVVFFLVCFQRRQHKPSPNVSLSIRTLNRFNRFIGRCVCVCVRVFGFRFSSQPPKAFAFDRASEPKTSLNAVGCHWACARSPSCSSCIVQVSARESQRRRMPLKPFDKQQESSEQSGAFQTQPVRANKAAKAAGGEKAGQPPPYWQ